MDRAVGSAAGQHDDASLCRRAWLVMDASGSAQATASVVALDLLFCGPQPFVMDKLRDLRAHTAQAAEQARALYLLAQVVAGITPDEDETLSPAPPRTAAPSTDGGGQ